mgnify:CR=1 FL=1
MITSVKEVRKIKEIVAEVKAELDVAGIPYGNPEQGIMIASATISLIFRTSLTLVIIGYIIAILPNALALNNARSWVLNISGLVRQIRIARHPGIPYGNPEQGIMIETPAAVIVGDELAKEVDPPNTFISFPSLSSAVISLRTVDSEMPRISFISVAVTLPLSAKSLPSEYKAG